MENDGRRSYNVGVFFVGKVTSAFFFILHMRCNFEGREPLGLGEAKPTYGLSAPNKYLLYGRRDQPPTRGLSIHKPSEEAPPQGCIPSPRVFF